MRRWLLIALLLPLAAPAVAEARSCPKRPGYKVVERHGPVVLTLRTPRRGYLPSTYRACHRRIGRDPVLLQVTGDEDASEDLKKVLRRGRYVAAFSQYRDKYQSNWISVALVDVVSGRRLAQDVRATNGDGRAYYALREAVLGPFGEVAWIEGDDETTLATLAGSQARIIASAGRLAGLAIDGDLVRFTADGQPRSAPLPPEAVPTRCPRRFGYGPVARQGHLVVSGRAILDESGEQTTYRVCDDRLGRDPVLAATSSGEGESEAVERLLLAGPYGAAITRYGSKYGDTQLFLWLVDTRTGARLARGVSTTGGGMRTEGRVVEAVLGPTGILALIEFSRTTSYSLSAFVDGRLVSVVGEDARRRSRLEDLRLEGDVVTWLEDGVRRERRLRG
ncbi:MAG TPA: hypothetical protein VF587_06765 [Solirubrobacteraceae bacterium]|jgi:hypothetical protein